MSDRRFLDSMKLACTVTVHVGQSSWAECFIGSDMPACLSEQVQSNIDIPHICKNILSTS